MIFGQGLLRKVRIEVGSVVYSISFKFLGSISEFGDLLSSFLEQIDIIIYSDKYFCQTRLWIYS